MFKKARLEAKIANQALLFVNKKKPSAGSGKKH
jgi:hypothetical protein